MAKSDTAAVVETGDYIYLKRGEEWYLYSPAWDVSDAVFTIRTASIETMSQRIKQTIDQLINQRITP